MALTTSQKYSVLHYLGWPPKTIISGDMCYSKTIADKLTTFPADAEAMLLALVARISTIDTQLSSMVARSNVKSVDDIEFFEDGTFDLRRERSKVIREIAVMTDIAMVGGGSCINVSV